MRCKILLSALAAALISVPAIAAEDDWTAFFHGMEEGCGQTRDAALLLAGLEKGLLALDAQHMALLDGFPNMRKGPDGSVRHRIPVKGSYHGIPLRAIRHVIMGEDRYTTALEFDVDPKTASERLAKVQYRADAHSGAQAVLERQGDLAELVCKTGG